MKNLALTVMGLVVVLVFSACSGYDEDLAPIVPPEQPTNTTTPNNDDDNDDNDEWETVMDSWYEMINSYSTIDSYIKTNKKESYNVQAPFAATLGEDLYFVTEKSELSRFINLESVSHMNTSYGEWYANSENDSIREILTNQKYECNLYNRSLRIQNAQAYRFLNGQRESFEMPVIVSSFAGHSSDTEEIERNDSIFNRETIKDSVRIAFGERPDIAPFYVSAKTVIDHFVKVKEKNETMPEPTFRVEGEILYISTRTASPIFIGGSKEQANWYEVSNVKTTVKTYVVVNGQKKEEYNNDELSDVNWQSAVYDAGYTNKWVPANINMDATGWTYVLQFSNGEYRGLTVPMNAALISSLKSFKKDNDAKQTPFLNEAQAVKRTFSDGIQYTVNGLYPYTVASK